MVTTANDLRQKVRDLGNRRVKGEANKFRNLLGKLERGQQQVLIEDYRRMVVPHAMSVIIDAMLTLRDGHTVLHHLRSSMSYDGQVFGSSGTTKDSRNLLRFYHLCKAIKAPAPVAADDADPDEAPPHELFTTNAAQIRTNILALPTDIASLKTLAQRVDPGEYDLWKTSVTVVKGDKVSNLSLLKVGGDPMQIEQSVTQWYIDQAALMEAFLAARGRPTTQSKLAQVMLHSFGKASSNYIAHSDYREVYQNPVFKDFSILYHRESGTNRLLNKPLAKLADVSTADLAGRAHFIHNMTFVESIRRTFPYHTLKGQIDSSEAFKAACDAALTLAIAGHRPDNLFALDITDWVADDDGFLEDVKTLLARDPYDQGEKVKQIEDAAPALEAVFMERAAERLDEEPGLDTLVNVAHMLNCSTLFACTIYQPPEPDLDALRQALASIKETNTTQTVIERCPLAVEEPDEEEEEEPEEETLKVTRHLVAQGVSREDAGPHRATYNLVFTPPFFTTEEKVEAALKQLYQVKGWEWPEEVDLVADDGQLGDPRAHDPVVRPWRNWIGHDFGWHSGTKDHNVTESVAELISRVGYRPDPFRTKAIWLDLCGLNEVLSSAGIKLARFAKGGPTPTVCASYKEFIAHPTVQKFKDLATFAPSVIEEEEEENPEFGTAYSTADAVGDQYPYLRIYPEAMFELLKGLEDYRFGGVVKFRASLTVEPVGFDDDPPDPVGKGKIVSNPAATLYSDPACEEEHALPDGVEWTAQQLLVGVEFYARLENNYNLELTFEPGENEVEVEVDAEGDHAKVTPKTACPVGMAYELEQCTDLLQTTYYRLLQAMKTAVFKREVFQDFLNQVELINQELSALLTFLEPHEDTAFPDAINRALTDGTLDDFPGGKHKQAPVIPGSVTIPDNAGHKMIHLRSSAMHCVTSAIGAAEIHKGLYADGGPAPADRLKVCVLEDCYYEESLAVDMWRNIGRVTFRSDYLALEADDLLVPGDHPIDEIVRGRLLLPDDEGAPLYDEDALSAYDDADNVLRLAAEGELKTHDNNAIDYTLNDTLVPFDVFICDFHHNISLGRTHYKTEKLIEHIKHLHRGGLFSNQFTVAIDSTIDFIASPEIHALLSDPYINNLIRTGKMNLVSFRSGQKFEQLGMDNYYGGWSMTVNDAGQWANFNTRMNAAEDELRGMNRWGHTHLSKYGAALQDRYRRLLMQSTWAVYDQLPAGFRSADLDWRPSAMRSDDPYNVFLDFKVQDREAAHQSLQAFLSRIADFRKIHKLEFTERPSFGFATANLVDITAAGYRLNIGLDGAASLHKWVDLCTGVHYWLAENAEADSRQMLVPCIASHSDYEDNVAKVYDELPAATTDDTPYPVKIRRLSDARHRQIVLELVFPPDHATNIPLDLAKRVRKAVKKKLLDSSTYQTYYFSTCSVRPLPHADRPVFRFIPGFELVHGMTFEVKPAEEAVAYWIAFFENFAQCLEPLLAEGYFRGPRSDDARAGYYGHVVDLLEGR